MTKTHLGLKETKHKKDSGVHLKMASYSTHNVSQLMTEQKQVLLQIFIIEKEQLAIKLTETYICKVKGNKINMFKTWDCTVKEVSSTPTLLFVQLTKSQYLCSSFLPVWHLVPLPLPPSLPPCWIHSLCLASLNRSNTCTFCHDAFLIKLSLINNTKCQIDTISY